MVKKISIGVIGIQGAISEHIHAMERALQEIKQPGIVSIVKNNEDLEKVDGLILPGGESTTISKALSSSGLLKQIKRRVEEDTLPIMGTCAGCILLAKEIVDPTLDLYPLKVMDIEVKRNAFGRQRESFEQSLLIKGFSDPYTAVFIRAPIITRVWGDSEILATLHENIVMVKQGKMLALSFHPELTRDLRIHKYFLELIE